MNVGKISEMRFDRIKSKNGGLRRSGAENRHKRFFGTGEYRFLIDE